MENKRKIVCKRAHTLCILAMMVNTLMMLFCFLACLSDSKAVIVLYKLVISCYILVQIEKVTTMMCQNPMDYNVLVRSCKRVAYACFACSIGSTAINTVVMMVSKGSMHIVCNVTALVVGALLLVGANVYQYGCEERVRE